MSQISLDAALRMSDQDYASAMKDVDEARLMRLKRDLAISEHQFGTDVLATHQARAKLADFHIHHREPRLAKILLEKATIGLETTLGQYHPETLAAMANLASIHATLDPPSLDLAEDYYQHVYTGYRLTLGYTSSLTIDAAAALGRLYMQQDLFSLAETYLAHAANGYEKLHGATSPETKASLRALAECYSRQDKLRPAVEVYQFLIECIEAGQGYTCPSLFSTANALATLLRDHGRVSEADRVTQWIMQRQFGTMECLAPPWKGKRLSAIHAHGPYPGAMKKRGQTYTSSSSSSSSTSGSSYSSEEGRRGLRSYASSSRLKSLAGFERPSAALSVKRTLSTAGQAPGVLSRTMSSGCASVRRKMTQGKGKGYLAFFRVSTLRT